MIEIHDNEIVSYEVNFKENKILMHTVSEQNKKVLILFEGVLTHFFRLAMLDNILDDIEEYRCNQFIMDNTNLLRETKNQCWPLYYGTLVELENRLVEEKCNYYIVNSSLGLTGWVLAQKMTIQEE